MRIGSAHHGNIFHQEDDGRVIRVSSFVIRRFGAMPRRLRLKHHPRTRIIAQPNPHLPIPIHLLQDARAAYALVVDPLDGTTNFLHGVPTYAVSIRVAVHGRLAAGVILDVPHGDRYTAVRDAGAFRNGERIAVSSIADPSRALIGTGFPFKHLVHLDVYQRQFAAVVRATSGIRRPGAAALDLASVANGSFDGFWELSLASWDIAAGVLLVREAGGVVTDLDGNDATGLVHGPLVAASRVMHEWLLTTLRAA